MATLPRDLILAAILLLFTAIEGTCQVSRRQNFYRAASISALSLWLECNNAANAAIGPNDISCVVTIKNSATVPAGSSPAVYLTARQDVGIWTAQIKNMKPPPVLTSRTAGPFEFPVEIVLTSPSDMTPEGQEIAQQWQSGKSPIVVSARLDSDGVAATRNAEDLVGKSITSKSENGEWAGCRIELTDRGVGGKFITKKK